MISSHVSPWHTLTCALLAILVYGSAPARAAPMGEPATAAQGPASILEVSKIGYDLANTIPIGFSATNAQPFVSTEVDTDAELAPTSSPMTNEEMALTEVAAVVAELATTKAAELKVRAQGEDVEKMLISKRAEEDKLANVVEAIKGVEGVTVHDGDFFAATTFRTNFPHQISTTPINTIMSPATTQAATESPEILYKLVKAAAAANEILAAALNVATMTVPNINTTTVNTMSDGVNLATTLQPEATLSTTAVASAREQVSDSDGLPEPIEITTTTTDVTTVIPDYTTTPSTVENKPAGNASVLPEVNDEKLLAKELESIRQSQTATPIDIQENITEFLEKATDAEKPKSISADMDNEASESMNIEETNGSLKTIATPPSIKDSPSDGENVVTNIIDNVATQTEPVVEQSTEVVSDISRKVVEDKKELKKESEESATEYTIKTTTTESLETLIAVESEARVPSKIVLFSEEEALEETTTTIPQLTTIQSESILTSNKATEASTEDDLLTETSTFKANIYTTGAQEESIATTESPDIKTFSPSASEPNEKLVEAKVITTAQPRATVTSNSLAEASDEYQIVSVTTLKLSEEEATTIFGEELSTSTQETVQSADMETLTNSIEEPIPVTKIPLTVKTSSQSGETTATTTELFLMESSRTSTDAPSLHTITTMATEELQHLGAFPNDDLKEVSSESTTKPAENILSTTLGTSSETTTSNSITTTSSTQPPEIEDTSSEFPKIGSTTELREQMPTSSEEVLSTTIITTEKSVESEDTGKPEAKTVTTVAAVEEQPFHASTEKEQQQHQHQQKPVVDGNDSAITNTVTTEESTTEVVDVTSSAASATTSTTTADIPTVNTPEVDATTTLSTTTTEPDITTTTTTTTLSPMSLIVAEHEARSLDRTPPRVSRIVNDDGVEVLTGYSIVHHMHAAALAALAAEGA